MRRKAQRRKSRRRRRRRRAGRRLAKGSEKSQTDRTVTGGSRVIARTVGAFPGRKGTSRTKTTVMVGSTKVPAEGKLAEVSTVAELLATETLENRVL